MLFELGVHVCVFVCLCELLLDMGMLLQGYLMILKSLGDGFSVAIFQIVKSWYDMSSFIRGDAFRLFLDHPHKPKDTPQWNVAINEFYVPSPRKQWLTVYRGS